jgi:branched-chain amino acid transport system substrate-binding protein
MRQHTRWRGIRVVATLAIVATLVALAGCGSSGSSTSATAAGAGTVSTLVGKPDAVITSPAAFIGGGSGPANPKLAPITVGFITSIGGPIGYPSTLASMNAVVNEVNRTLGGIHGHPLKLKACFVAATNQEAQACADEMINDPNVKFVVQGEIIQGAQVVEAALSHAHVLEFGGIGSGSDYLTPDAYFLISATTSLWSEAGYVAAHVLHAKSGGVIYPTIPGGIGAAEEARAGLVQNGISTKVVGFPSTAGDLTSPLTAAGAQTADVLIPIAVAPECVTIYHDLQQLGSKIKVIANPLCLDPAVQAALHGQFPVGWYFPIDVANEFDPADTAAAMYISSVKKYAGPNSAHDTFGGATWGVMATVAKLLNRINGPVTAAALKQQVLSYRGPVIEAQPEMECGQDPQLPASCGDANKFVEYLGNGRWKDVSGWITPPTSG